MVFLGNKRSLICLFPSFCLFHQNKVMVDRNMLSPYSELIYAVWCRRYPPFAYLHLSGSKSAASSFRNISQNRRSQQCWGSRMALPHCHSTGTSFPHHSGTIAMATWAHFQSGNGATVVVWHLPVETHSPNMTWIKSGGLKKQLWQHKKSKQAPLCSFIPPVLPTDLHFNSRLDEEKLLW